MNTPPPPPPPFSSVPSPPPPPPPPAKKGNKTLIIVLCVLAGLFVIIGGCVATCAYVVGKKASAYAKDAQKNPAYAALSFAASMNPEVEIVSKNENTGIITLKNKKTGEVVTVDTTQLTAANIGSNYDAFANSVKVKTPGRTSSEPASTPENSSAMTTPSSSNSNSDSDSSAPVEKKISSAQASAFSATVAKLPAYMAVYPGAKTTEANYTTMFGTSSGTYNATTSAKPETVTDYYEKKLTAEGFTVVSKNSESNENGPVSTLMVTATEPQRVASVTAESQAGGKVQISVTFTQVKQ